MHVRTLVASVAGLVAAGCSPKPRPDCDGPARHRRGRVWSTAQRCRMGSASASRRRPSAPGGGCTSPSPCPGRRRT